MVLFVGPWNLDQLRELVAFSRQHGIRIVMDEMWRRTQPGPRPGYAGMEPLAFRSEWISSVDKQVYGYDGRFWWFASYERGGDLDHVQALMGDEDEKDRERIQEEIDETRYLLRFFFLANLTGPEIAIQKCPDEKIQSFGGEIDTFVLRRLNRAPESAEPELSLWLRKDDLALVRATAHATGPGTKSLIFDFRYDERVQPRVKGVRFPFKIETREKPHGADRDRLVNRATVEEGGIAFAEDLPQTLFKMPRKEPR